MTKSPNRFQQHFAETIFYLNGWVLIRLLRKSHSLSARGAGCTEHPSYNKFEHPDKELVFALKVNRSTVIS